MNAPFPHPETPAASLAVAGNDVCVATVSLIIPLQDEEEAIAPFLEAVYRNTELLTEQGIAFDFIFVNDGSTDATLETLLLAQKDDPRIRVVDLSRNFGTDAAMTAGLDLCDKDAAIMMRIDTLDPPHIIPDLIGKWREGYEVVLARPAGPRGPAVRQSLSPWQMLRDLFSLRKASRGSGDFRLIDRQVIDALRALPERQRLTTGLLGWVGFNATEIEYAREPHRAETASVGRRHRSSEGSTEFSGAPLEVWAWVGVLALICAAAILAHTLISGAEIPGYAPLMLSILFLGGIQLLGIGLIGKYLAGVYAEIKQRPVYLVRRTFGN
jgi:glycosyltransferase involved in cell wall biosynthesis